jgi:N-acetylmuramoyl-L-alanine amidase
MFKVMIDPGHGGIDPGAVSGEVEEANIALAIGIKVCNLLNKWKPGIAILNRWIDYTLSLDDRVANANTVGVNLFVSIHCNASSNEAADGVETYCYKFGGKGEQAARNIHAELLAAGLRPDRGVKEGNFQVLRDTTMPAVLVELGFISNDQDRAALLDPHQQDLITSALAMGIINTAKAWGGI